MVAAREVAGAAGFIDTSSENISRFLPYSEFALDGTSCKARNHDSSWSLLTSSRWHLASASTRFGQIHVEQYKRGSTGTHSKGNLCDSARARTRCQPRNLSTECTQHRLPRDYVQLELCKWYSTGNISKRLGCSTSFFIGHAEQYTRTSCHGSHTLNLWRFYYLSTRCRRNNPYVIQCFLENKANSAVALFGKQWKRISKHDMQHPPSDLGRRR